MKLFLLLLIATIISIPQITLAQNATPEDQGSPVSGLPQTFTVAVVKEEIDGDKIKVDVSGATSELNFIQADADEPGECFYKDSVAYVKKLLPVGTTVYLESDAKLTDKKDRI